MLHVSGYGRGGPKSDSPGFGTLAEAMSGFAHLTGQPDGPPTLPPFMLADGVAALAATYAVMMALYHRDVHGGGGQLVDVNLIEPLARLIESSTLAFDQLGIVPGRVGNRLDASAPRNAYRTADDKWLAISSASPNIAARVYRAIDRPDLAEDPDYVDPRPPPGAGRRGRRAGRRLGRSAHPRRGDGGVRGGVGGRGTRLRRRAAAGRRAPAFPGNLRAARRSRPRRHDRAGAGGRAERDARADRRTSAATWAPTTTPSTASCSTSTPTVWPPSARPASSDAEAEGGTSATAPGPTIGAGDTGQQRADVREGRRAPAPISSSWTSRTPAPRWSRSRPGPSPSAR